MNVLGIHWTTHDNAAALAVDGRVVAAVEEERLSRMKLSLAKTDPSAKLDRRSSVIDCPDGPLTPCAFGQEGACNRSGAQEDGSRGCRSPRAVRGFDLHACGETRRLSDRTYAARRK